MIRYWSSSLIIGFLLIISPVSFASSLQAEQDFLYAKRLADDGHKELAVEAFKVFLATYPDNPHSSEAKWLMGTSLYAAKKYKEAREAFQRYVIDYPNDSRTLEAFLKIADCFHLLDDKENEILALWRIPIFYPQSPETPPVLVRVARLLMETDNFNDAEIPLQQVLNQHPESAVFLEAKLLWAHLLARRGNFTLAEKEAWKVAQKLEDAVLTAEALTYQAECLDTLGRLEEADQVRRMIIEKFSSTPMLPRALTLLGQHLIQNGDFKKAEELLLRAKDTAPDDETKALSLLGLADLNFIAKNYDAALDLLTQIPKPDRPEKLFRIALIKEAQLDFTAAAEIYKSISLSEDLNYSAASAFRAGDLFKRWEKPKEAAENFLLFERIAQDTILKAEGRYQAAKCLITVDDSLCAALLADFDELYPRSPLIDDALFLRAAALYQNGKFHLAYNVWQKLLTSYPFSPWLSEAEMSSELIKEHQLRDRDPAEKVADLLAQVAKGLSRSDLALSLGEIYLNDYKDYKKAIDLFEQVLATEGLHASKYERGKVLLLEALRNRFSQFRLLAHLNDDSYAARFTEITASSIKRLNELKSNVDDESLLAEIDFLLNQIQYCAEEEGAKTTPLIQSLEEFIQNHPNSSFVSEVHRQLGKIYTQKFQAESNSQHYQKAIAHLLASLQTATDSSRSNEVKLLLADCYLAIGKREQAITTYQEIVKDAGNALSIQAIVKLLDFPEVMLKEKISYLRKLEQDAYYHPISEELHLKIANLYLEANRFADAEQELISHFSKSSPGNPGLLVLQEKPDEWLFLLGRAKEGQGFAEPAISAFRRFLVYHQEGDKAVEVHRQLAELLKKENRNEEALVHLDWLAKHEIPDSLQFDAVSRRIQILFEEGDYETVRNLALQLAQSASNEDSAFCYYQLAIVCLYRLGKAEQAQEEALELRKTYKKRADVDEATAWFYLEKGRYYSRLKDFENAEKAFRTVIDSYKGSRWIPEAKYELGRDFLIRNLYDEGLAILTALPDEYPEHPILGLVFMTLAGYYLESGNFSDCIVNYELILADEQYRHLWERVYPLEIQAYKQAGFYAGAVKATQAYLEHFPEAPDRFARQMELGAFFSALEQYDLAEAQFRKLLPYADIENEYACQFSLAETLEKRERWREAIVAYLHVQYIDKPSKLNWVITAYYNIGRCYEKLGDNDHAVEFYRMIVEKEGLSSPFGRKAQQQIDRIVAK